MVGRARRLIAWNVSSVGFVPTFFLVSDSYATLLSDCGAVCEESHRRTPLENFVVWRAERSIRAIAARPSDKRSPQDCGLRGLRIVLECFGCAEEDRTPDLRIANT